MIQRIVYSSVAGSTQAAPATVLTQFGPCLDVVIMPPRIIRDRLEKQNLPYPTSRVRALIDTGASSSVIHPAIAAELNLTHTGYQKITSVQDQQDQPVYFGAILFSWGHAAEVPLIACPLTHVRCLIGRDILSRWYVTYDGVGGTIVICD